MQQTSGGSGQNPAQLYDLCFDGKLFAMLAFNMYQSANENLHQHELGFSVAVPSVIDFLCTEHVVHSCPYMVNDIAVTHHPDRQGDKRMPDSCSIGLSGCTCLQTLNMHNARVSACSSQARAC